MDHNSPEALLVARVQGGDDRAFEELMGRFKRPILNFVYRMTGDATEAEDIALAVFVRAYRALTSSGFQRRNAEFSTWLFQNLSQPTQGLITGKDNESRLRTALWTPESSQHPHTRIM